jgi:hypothetical protein
MATSPDNGGEGRDWFCLKRRCHDSGRKKSTYQRSLITPRQQRFTVYVRHSDNTTVGLETFDDGDCLLWVLLTPSNDVAAIIAAIP